ncbi:MAG: hypothetical protein HPY50_08580 [Firmicutes bacterium]|nr:hypothetical protein [Bacillota bacterium]
MEVKKVIGPYDPSVIYDLARQEIVTDRDDASHKTDDPDFFEWWYFDVHSDDGCTVVVALKDRDYSKMHLPPVPQVTLQVVTPGGQNVNIVRDYPGLVLEASTEYCDVKIGENFWARGRYPEYTFHAEEDGVVVEFTMKAILPGWRPGTGCDYFDAEKTKHFDWVVAAPRAEAVGTVTIGGKTMNVKGVGYHDHNFGNVALAGNIARWHWGRTYTDEYTIIFSYIVMGNQYGRVPLPVFGLGKGGRMLLSSGDLTDRYKGALNSVPVTANTYPEEFLLEVPYNNDKVKLRLCNNQLLEERDLAPQLPRPEGMAKPAYIRLGSDLELTVPLAEGAEVVKGKVIHELMILELSKLE